MKTVFNEADRYLLDHWKQVIEFESGIETVKEKFHALVGSLQEELEEREWYEADFQMHINVKVGNIGICRKSWNTSDHEWNWPGLWLEGLTLESIFADDDPTPATGIWIAPVKRDGLDRDEVKRKILAAAATVLKKDFPPRSGEDNKYIIRYVFPEHHTTLGQSLLKEEGRSFINIVLAHADRMAELLPAMDTVLGKPSRK